MATTDSTEEVHACAEGENRLVATNGPHVSFLLPQLVPADWLSTILLVAQYPGGRAQVMVRPTLEVVQVTFREAFGHVCADTTREETHVCTISNKTFHTYIPPLKIKELYSSRNVDGLREYKYMKSLHVGQHTHIDILQCLRFANIHLCYPLSPCIVLFIADNYPFE